MPGKIVVFEGIDGAGTEAQSKRLLQHLKGKKIPCERLYYPNYDNPTGRLLHEYLHSDYTLSPDMQLVLYGGDMLLDRERILSFLKEGKVVILDRYFTSTLAYQTLDGLKQETCLKFARMFKLPKPDYVFYLKISPETSMKRKQMEKGSGVDRNERDMKLQERLARKYDEISRDNVFGKWFTINGEKPVEEVFSQVRKVLRV
jgi:dTMP kinase